MNWEIMFKVGTTGIGGLIGWLIGGWGGLLPVLFAFAVIDQCSGLVASYIEGKLSSKIGFIGIAKKVMIMFIVMVANLIDHALMLSGLTSGQIVRDATILFYIGNELLSIVENAGRMGVPLPAQLTNAVAVLKGKAGDTTIANRYKGEGK